MKICPQCGKQNPDHVAGCVACGTALSDNPFAADVHTPLSPQQQGDSTGGVIPYKNPHALIAYYLGIVSGIPLIGLPFGIAAFILGILGLRARSRNPVIKGSIHAGIGIGCGCFFSLLWIVMLVAIVASLVS